MGSALALTVATVATVVAVLSSYQMRNAEVISSIRRPGRILHFSDANEQCTSKILEECFQRSTTDSAE